MARDSYMKGVTGVFGWPVAENPTIIMQQSGFDALDIPFVYLNFEVKPEELKAAVQGARAMGFAGFNCTIPHKTEIIKYLDEVQEDALVMGAVNTVFKRDGRLIGANTDGKGFIKALEVNGISCSGKRVTVLGAGGAARALCVELANNGVGEITLANRTEERGKALAELINTKTSAHCDFFLWNKTYEPDGCDILLNATSIGLYPNTEQKPDVAFDAITPDMIVCDVIPNPPETAFLKEAKKRGARCLDGQGMLVYQGTIAFELWTGKPAPVEAMRAALNKEFSEE